MSREREIRLEQALADILDEPLMVRCMLAWNAELWGNAVEALREEEPDVHAEP